ncbi:reverse transcriptase [Gossypium australe]|uniref:Reverse transcriptase n=1 Tax=Gossypium australe TaxID=47621 RepID=A0A5B6UWK6_9ROSI|nr:reverse transcriptase [Gossypium australe]
MARAPTRTYAIRVREEAATPDLIAGKANVVADALSINDNSTLRYRDMICVPNDLDLKHDILSEAHSSTYSIHLDGMKMYCDLKQM